jgi:hypothetical protein
MAKQNSLVSPEQLVKIWQQAKTREEVVEKTGLSKIQVANKIQWLRYKKVPLKRFKARWTSRCDYPALIALAKKYGPKE